MEDFRQVKVTYIQHFKQTLLAIIVINLTNLVTHLIKLKVDIIEIGGMIRLKKRQIVPELFIFFQGTNLKLECFPFLSCLHFSPSQGALCLQVRMLRSGEVRIHLIMS